MIMKENKPIEIQKSLIYKAWLSVKRNAGASGIDGQSITDFEQKLEANLYKIWNRMSSGSYFPPPIRGVEIPKKSGSTRTLGIPTIADRVAQTAVRNLLMNRFEAIFDDDSYGYRPGKSAHDALAVTRERCWKYDWVLEYDIKGLFDNISHDLLMKAVRMHVEEKWMVMYIERWLKAPMILEDGTEVPRDKGTPQGGVISPLLANLFMHYVTDKWARRELPGVPFCRYADDGLFHCKSKVQAEKVLDKLRDRLQQCNLEAHPVKTKIVYCQDEKRKFNHEFKSFEFLGYEFICRKAKNRKTGKYFKSFLPAIGKRRLKELKWYVKYKLSALRRLEWSLEHLAKEINPIISGWYNYYAKFYPSRMSELAWFVDNRLLRWLRLKYKNLRRSKKKAVVLMKRIQQAQPKLFFHWGKIGL
jgi:RNA-directed DNA polymerase